MKKHAVAAPLLFLVLSHVAFADGTQMLKSTTPPNTGPATIICKATDTNNYGRYNAVLASLPYEISLADTIVINVYSDAGSSATVTLSTAATPTGPWYVVATITDPSATGEQWSIPRTNYVKMSVTVWASGNVRACIAAFRVDKKIY